MNKVELKKQFLELRAVMSPAEAEALSVRISERFFEEVDLGDVRNFNTYINIPKFNEMDTSLIYTRVWREFPAITVSVPRVDHATGEMDIIAFTPETELTPGRWGIPQPAAGEAIEPKSIDLVIVPLLCFDRRLHRVGYGKGFYDRFLKQCRPDCGKVGLSYFPPVAEIGDVHAGDVALDMCITPDGVFSPERSAA